LWYPRWTVSGVEFLPSGERSEQPAPGISGEERDHTIASAAGLLEGTETVVVSVDTDPLDS